MKKRYVFLIVVTLLIGVPILRFIASKKQMEQEMKEAVYDSMITELIKKNIKEYDPNAFTDDGIIKSYEIDSETISQNPMGGIGFLIYVNNLSDLYVRITLHSNNGGGLVVNSFNPSPELINLLEEKYGQIYWWTNPFIAMKQHTPEGTDHKIDELIYDFPSIFWYKTIW